MNSWFWLQSTKSWFDDNASGSGGVSSPPSPAPSGGSAPTSAPPSQGSGAPPQQVPSSIPADSGSEASAEGGADPFAGMDDDVDFVDLGLGGPSTETPSGEQPAPQAPGASAQGEPKPAAAPAPPQAAAPPAQVPGAQKEDVGSAPRSPLEQAAEGFRSNHAALSEWASQNLFALSKEEAEALETDAVAQIPKLMGKVYSQSLQAIASLMQNFVPQMVSQGVQNQQRVSARAAEALNEFYSSNPHLNHAQHGAAVDKWARVFRAANPKAPRSEAIAFVGRAVSAELGVAPSSQPARRAAPPFAPARPGGRAPTSQKGEQDPYAGMEDEYD